MIRFDMFFRIIKNKIESIFQPKTVRLLHVGGKEMDQGSAISALSFFFIVIAISALATFLYVWDNIDLETSFSLTACMINNTGLGFRGAGPANTEAFLSPFSMGLSILIMILGRLEFYAVLVLLLPSFWKKGR